MISYERESVIYLSSDIRGTSEMIQEQLVVKSLQNLPKFLRKKLNN